VPMPIPGDVRDDDAYLHADSVQAVEWPFDQRRKRWRIDGVPGVAPWCFRAGVT
jgi:hypothetical protein